MRRLAAIALFTIACTGAAPHTAATASAQTLTLSYSQADVYHYKFVLMSDYTIQTVALTEQERIDLAAKETLTVSSVDSTGMAAVMVTFTDANLTTTLGSGQATAIINDLDQELQRAE